MPERAKVSSVCSVESPQISGPVGPAETHCQIEMAHLEPTQEVPEGTSELQKQPPCQPTAAAPKLY